MASREAWADRSAPDKRKLFGRFGLLYLVIALAGFGFGWLAVGFIFGLGAVGLGVAWFATPDSDVETSEPRAKPEWMRAMDDPDAPDLTLPEYRDGQPTEADASGVTDASATTSAPMETPTTPPEAPPSPTS